MNLTNCSSLLAPIEAEEARFAVYGAPHVYATGDEVRIETVSRGPNALVRVSIMLVNSSFLCVMALHDFRTEQAGDGVERLVKRGEQFWITRDQVYAPRA